MFGELPRLDELFVQHDIKVLKIAFVEELFELLV
jgi:hypothetical protein